MTGGTAVMVPGENRGTPDREDAFRAKMFRDRLTHYSLRAGKLHGRQELAVGQLRQPKRFSGDSDEVLHVVVPGREVGIANRPIDRNSVAKVRFEIQIAPPVTLAAPHNGAPAYLPPADPPERLAIGGCVRVQLVADEKLR